MMQSHAYTEALDGNMIISEPLRPNRQCPRNIDVCREKIGRVTLPYQTQDEFTKVFDRPALRAVHEYTLPIGKKRFRARDYQLLGILRKRVLSSPACGLGRNKTRHKRGLIVHYQAQSTTRLTP